jgi:hypothetical protein
MRGTRQNLPSALQIAYKFLKKNTNLTNPGLA